MKRKYYQVTIQELPKDVEQVLLGSLMGDAGVYYCDANNYSVKYLEPHGKNQIEYLNYKAEVYRRVFNVHIYDMKYVTLNMNSKLLIKYRQLFYPNGKKTISTEILESLTPLAIAIWHCDDGSISASRIELATDCFGYEGNLLIQKWFKEMHNIDFILVNDKRNSDGFRYSLRTNKLEETFKFINLIKNHIPECMKYKIDIEYQLVKKRGYSKSYWYKNRENLIEYHKEYYLKNKKRLSLGNKEYWKQKYYSDLEYRKRSYERSRQYRLRNIELCRKRCRDNYYKKKAEKAFRILFG